MATRGFPYTKAVRKMNPTHAEIKQQLNRGVGSIEQQGNRFLKKNRRHILTGKRGTDRHGKVFGAMPLKGSRRGSRRV